MKEAYLPRRLTVEEPATQVGMSPKLAVLANSQPEELLHGATFGFLGLADGQEPYVVPVNFVYLNGTIYFHGAVHGRKMEIIERYPDRTVAFTVAQEDGFTFAEGPCAIGTRYRSIMVQGRARIVTDEGEKLAALEALLVKGVPAGGYRPLTAEMVSGYRSRGGSPTAVVAIEIEVMRGKKAPP